MRVHGVRDSQLPPLAHTVIVCAGFHLLYGILPLCCVLAPYYLWTREPLEWDNLIRGEHATPQKRASTRVEGRPVGTSSASCPCWRRRTGSPSRCL